MRSHWLVFLVVALLIGLSLFTAGCKDTSGHSPAPIYVHCI
jgi:hypothetical protein